MKSLTPVKAIRAKCLDCMNGKKCGIRQCEDYICPLHLYRMGHNPKRKGIGNKNPYFKKKYQS